MFIPSMPSSDQKTINDFYSELLIQISILIKAKLKSEIEYFCDKGKPQPATPPMPAPPLYDRIPASKPMSAKEAYDKNKKLLNNTSLNELVKSFNSLIDNSSDLRSESFREFLKRDPVIQLIISVRAYEGNAFFASLNYLL
ncbi:hypothetical protein PQD09_gp66 [Providencia phage PSTCR4]|uniref:Uncharacterized protein n=1 Tax=Providencia phage PSTCR4 TaxID=2783546 RepID=A0A873WX14_9CAUD|nr:hypothetical protein PQD09_gp66 [Providencia phage PSTCR4]QPB12087.1 hypothetical protein [Providencia phage PSTCR4]